MVIPLLFNIFAILILILPALTITKGECIGHVQKRVVVGKWRLMIDYKHWPCNCRNHCTSFCTQRSRKGRTVEKMSPRYYVKRWWVIGKCNLNVIWARCSKRIYVGRSVFKMSCICNAQGLLPEFEKLGIDDLQEYIL